MGLHRRTPDAQEARLRAFERDAQPVRKAKSAQAKESDLYCQVPKGQLIALLREAKEVLRKMEDLGV